MKRALFYTLLILGLADCDTLPSSEESKAGNTSFTALSPEETGVTFSNQLEETLSFNIFNYLYFYNGGGVAAGDLNGDGWVDLYFTANQHDNALYLNQGDFRFEDVTEQAGVKGMGGWTTGVTMADVNADGKLDIYVSQLGDYQHISGRNQLYINLGNNAEGVPQFENQARAYGLELRGFSTQAAFFDYDRDGDLDMYQLMHSVHSNGTFGSSDRRQEKHNLAGDRLLRNDGGKFVDVTESSGIFSSALGYGLGIGIGDFNRDGWPDVYVGNDFHEDDYLYMNNGDGTFSEQLRNQIRHTSRFSMGNDIADFNNDGWPDVMSLDMLPRDYQKLKASTAEDPYNIYHQKLKQGYYYQYARNNLQLNQGNGHFSEVGLMTGVYATDWSWSGLFADLDLDGRKDIYIANGIKRRTTDQDYVSYVSSEAIRYRLKGDLTEEELDLVSLMPEVKIANFVFRNTGDLTFSEVSADWGLNQETFSNGAAYADLDNDGDLDLIVNNLDDPASILRNDTRQAGKEDQPNYLQVTFAGNEANPLGLGAVVEVSSVHIGQQRYTHYLTRGYQSSVASGLTIGLGNDSLVSQLTITWPDGKQQQLEGVAVNQSLTVNYAEAQEPNGEPEPSANPLLEDVTEEWSVDYAHQENYLVEFNREYLMPHMVSTEGPDVAVADVNGDGREDFVVTGGNRQPTQLFLQAEGTFQYSPQAAFQADSIAEEIAISLADMNGDGAPDLLTLPGGNEWGLGHPNTQPRLYWNDGKGGFTKAENAFPSEISLQGGAMAVADMDQDGDLDVFLGARSIPYRYGHAPASYLLENDGQGHFTNVTESLLPHNGLLGMVTDAHWADMDGDQRLDLVVAAEWEKPLVLLQRESGTFSQLDGSDHGLPHRGLWYTLQPYDVDQDGDLDLLAGNLGLNSKLKASPNEPIRLYAEDLDNNESIDHLLTYYEDGEEVLFATKREITEQLLSVKKRYPEFTAYSQASFEEIIPPASLEGVLTLAADELRSGVFVNNGAGQFTFRPLAREAQLAPIRAWLPLVLARDNFLLAGGNFHANNIQRGRYDASYGWLLYVGESGKMETVPQRQSGLDWVGEVRDLATIRVGNQSLILVIRNDEPLLVMRPTPLVDPTL